LITKTETNYTPTRPERGISVARLEESHALKTSDDGQRSQLGRAQAHGVPTMPANHVPFTPILGGLSSSYPPFSTNHALHYDRIPLSTIEVSTRPNDQNQLSARFMQQQAEALAEENRQKQARKMQKFLKKQARSKSDAVVKGKEELTPETKQRKRVRRQAPRKTDAQLAQLNVVTLPSVIPNFSRVDCGALSNFLQEKGLKYDASDEGIKTSAPINVATPTALQESPRVDTMRIETLLDTSSSPNVLPIHDLKVNDSPIRRHTFVTNHITSTSPPPSHRDVMVEPERRKKSVSFSLPEARGPQVVFAEHSADQKKE